MSSESQRRARITDIALATVRDMTGLRPAAPARNPDTPWVPWDLDLLAFDVVDDELDVRLIALALPLPPLLHNAGAALRDALEAAGHHGMRIRLTVTDLDAAALPAGPG